MPYCISLSMWPLNSCGTSSPWASRSARQQDKEPAQPWHLHTDGRLRRPLWQELLSG